MKSSLLRPLKILIFSAVLATSGQFVLAEKSAKNEKSEPPKVGDEAADFELPAVGGRKARLSALTDKGPVVLVVLRGYPGYQCPVCNRQVAEFLEQARKFQDANASVVLVYPGPANDLQLHGEEFVRGKTFPNNFHLLLDPDYSFTNAYHLRWEAPAETAYPATFVVDSKRKVRFAKVSKSHGGRASADEVLKALNEK